MQANLKIDTKVKLRPASGATITQLTKRLSRGELHLLGNKQQNEAYLTLSFPISYDVTNLGPTVVLPRCTCKSYLV